MTNREKFRWNKYIDTEKTEKTDSRKKGYFKKIGRDN